MARKYDPETLEDDDTAPVPSRVFKVAPLRIDEHIRRRIIPGRKPNIRADIDEPLAIHSGRRMLRHAIEAAVGAKLMSPSDWREDWLTTCDTAKKAAAAIETFIGAISKDDGSSRGRAEVILQIRALDSLVLTEALKKAERDAGILEEAGRISEGLAADCARRLAGISKAHPRVIDVEKRAFVETLAHGWTYLMETRPGSTATADQNPFLQFVEAAWLDWKGAGRVGDESFVQALNQALKTLTPSSAASTVNDHAAWRGLP